MSRNQFKKPERQNISKEVQVSVLIQEEVLEKIKAIAERKGVPTKNEVHHALLERIENYEKENGLLFPPKNQFES